jgi:hypothetical protein
LLALNGPARWGAARWPLAALAVTLLQLAASATGLSSVRVDAVSAAATFVVPVLIAAVVATTVWRRVATVAAAAALMVAAPVLYAPTARAHDPGQGPAQGSAELTVVGNGDGGLSVTADGFTGLGPGIEPVRLLARRANRVVTADLRRDGSGAESFTGRVVLPEPGRWFVYVEVRQQEQVLEAWLPVQQTTSVTTAARRPVYLPAGTGPRPGGEYGAAAGLLGIGMVLMVWSGVTVRRYRRSWSGAVTR